MNNANKIAVIASHVGRAQWLYPTPHLPSQGSDNKIPPLPPDDPNKHRPFAQIEHVLTSNLSTLISSTTESDIRTTIATKLAGALTMALAYISKTALLSPSTISSNQTHSGPAGSFSVSDPSSVPSQPSSLPTSLTSRILVLSVSPDLSDQYIPTMNGIFACQRLHCPIDVLKISEQTVFLQQAADATRGIYISLLNESVTNGRENGNDGKNMVLTDRNKAAGLLQTLMLAFLPDPTARRYLYTPSGQATTGVDFRAACFCHRKVVDVGYVCSVCLSIFCSPELDEQGKCLTCGTELAVGKYAIQPVVVNVAATNTGKKKDGGVKKKKQAQQTIS